ncbi:hypothetical protein PHLCEN_2v1424 [Hermanssonia centrifuga]|uniref:CCHC-type domain-containing protein n=1 Tax=Hermanssonia centrifuga TaxID=98765 RepID=A0A2R6RZZ8_9APHY|nr:hypothetical protein PHLCEN_2v1424 [Hermanssonia centrifuga]
MARRDNECESQTGHGVDGPPLFYVDTETGNAWSHLEYCAYSRHSEDVLGAEEAKDERDIRRCFNCGTPNHVVDECPNPRDRALISLSRQLFNFFRKEGLGDFRRIHEVEEWKRKRLEWLETFEPGKIQGPLLREALYLDAGDPGEYVGWLRNMTQWGYPKGWVGDVDPRLRAWKIIVQEEEEEEDDDEITFTIHGDGEASEALCLIFTRLRKTEDDDGSFPVDCADSASDTSATPSKTVSNEDCTPPSPRRWAIYPDTSFSSSRLPIYDGFILPPILPDAIERREVSSTYSVDREILWNSIVNKQSTTLPWRLPGIFHSDDDIVQHPLFSVRPNTSLIGHWGNSAWSSDPTAHGKPLSPPPPPSSTPPPLPPPKLSADSQSITIEPDDADMEISDSE